MASAPREKIPIPTVVDPSRTISALAKRIPANPPSGKSMTSNPIWAVPSDSAC